MKRRCEILKNEWLEGMRINDPAKKISVYFDCKNEKEIREIFENGKLKKKMRVILSYVLNGHYDEDHYSKEEVSDKAKGVTAMKLKGASSGNIRIVCKEFYHEGKMVVVVTAVKKKTQKVNKKLKELYERVGGYEYEFKD